MRYVALAAALGAVTTPAYGDEVITAGGTIKGRLEKGDAKRQREFVDTILYEGDAGEELRILKSRGSDLRGRIEGPAGFKQDLQFFMGASNVRLPQRGRYKILVSTDASFGPKPYEVTLSRVTNGSGQSTLVMGQRIEGGFVSTDSRIPEAPALLVDTYTYMARAGETVALLVDSQDPVTPTVKVLGEDGFERFGTVGAGSEFTLHFPKAGIYRFLVSGEGGNYSLEMRPKISVADAVPIGHLSHGGSVSVTYQPGTAVNSYGDAVNIYTFDAKKGERLSIVTPEGSPVYGIKGPAGKSVASQFNSGTGLGLARLDVEVLASGRYQFEARTYERPYSIQLVPMDQGAAMMASATAATERQRLEKAARIAQLIRLGNQRLNSGDNEGALAAFDEVKKIEDNIEGNIDADIGAGRALYRLGHFMAARFSYEHALIRNPNNATVIAELEETRRAEEAHKRDQQARFGQQQRDRSFTVGDAVGAFVGTVSAVKTAQAEAEARAAAEQRRQQASQQARQAQVASVPSPTRSPVVTPLPPAPSKVRPVSPGGGPCAKLVSKGSRRVQGTSEQWTEYNYRLENFCGVMVVFTLKFGNGEFYNKEVPVSRDWFCTDGKFGNMDCKGGVVGFDYR